MGRRGAGINVGETYTRCVELVLFEILTDWVLGYSIVDNVIIFQGTVSIVTDTPEDYPSVHSIVSARGPGRNNWEIITTLDARERFGTYGGM